MGITRRSFLHAAGLGGVAATLAACTGSGDAAAPGTTAQPPTTTATAPVGTSGGPTPIDYPALAARLRGRLLTPDRTGYDLARRGYNPLHDGHRPAAVALCAGPEDVVACVRAAAAARAPIAARGGGHSYPGYSNADEALVVDLAGLAGVTVNPDGTAVVGAGVRLVDVYSALAGAGRCLPAGSCPSVGVAGLTLGGGIGVLSRQYGLTCDHLVSATVVTADGATRTASAASEPDLFWALRGGGGGNFGVVTSFTFDTVPAPTLTVFLLGFPAGSVPAVFAAWQPWLAGAPDELWSNCNITGGSPPTATVAGCLVGPAGAANALVADLVNRIGQQPATRSVRTLSYLDAMRYFAGCSSLSAAQCVAESRGAGWKREAFVASSRMLAGPARDPAALVALCDGRPDLHLIVDGLGGAVGRIGPADTAFPHRTAFASAQVYLKTTPGALPAARRSVSEVRDRLGGQVGTAAYVNYLDATMPDWGRAYYGANLDRLRRVAAHYDPNNVFAFPQAVSRA